MSQHRLDQQLNSEAQRSSSLVAQLRAMVAEREAQVRQLELEIGQLSVQVSGCWLSLLAPKSGQSPHYSEKLQPLPLLHLCSSGRTISYLARTAPHHSFHLALRPMLHTPFLSSTDLIVSLLLVKPVCGSPGPQGVQAPASLPSPSPAVAFILMTQGGGHSASTFIHIPGSRVAEWKHTPLSSLQGTR